MKDDFKFFDGATFTCFNCDKDSRFSYETGRRGTVLRFRPDRDEDKAIQFMCEHCGTANDIKISLEDASRLLRTLSSTDPDIINAINQMKLNQYKRN